MGFFFFDLWQKCVIAELTDPAEAQDLIANVGPRYGVIETPEQPANVCFGGEDYDTLFITARNSLYSVKTLVKGAKPDGAKW